VRCIFAETLPVPFRGVNGIVTHEFIIDLEGSRYLTKLYEQLHLAFIRSIMQIIWLFPSDLSLFFRKFLFSYYLNITSFCLAGCELDRFCDAGLGKRSLK
jgi:hypothetical protein